MGARLQGVTMRLCLVVAVDGGLSDGGKAAGETRAGCASLLVPGFLAGADGSEAGDVS